MVKKFFTNESFATLIEEIKSHVKKAVSSKADTEHSHDDLYYTETEVDTLISNLTSGTTPVAKAETAEQATKATQDANGNVIIDTYETKEDAQTKYDTITNAKADWNQNDESAIDYVKNRTHYSEVVNLHVLDETTYDVSSNKVVKLQEPLPNMIIGATYTVVCNGVEHTLEAQDYGGIGVVLSGNPFLVLAINESMWTAYGCKAMIQITTEITSVTLSIDGVYEDIHKLDSKYINSNIVTGVADGSSRGILSTKEDDTYALGKGAVAIGYNTKASGQYSYAEGDNATASGNSAHAEGYNTTASGFNAHAEGYYTVASGGYSSHAEGENTTASGRSSHAEGYKSVASGKYSHAEGYNNTIASGDYSHTEGNRTRAVGIASHAQGVWTRALGKSSHAEGDSDITNNASTNGIIISGDVGATTYTVNSDLDAGYASLLNKAYVKTYDIDIASVTVSNGKVTAISFEKTLDSANTLTNKTIIIQTGSGAGGVGSHAEGKVTVAHGDYQHTQGKYNIIDSEGKYAHIVGNGTAMFNRSNAHTLDWDGNAWFAGEVYVGGTGQDSGEKLVKSSEVTTVYTSIQNNFPTISNSRTSECRIYQNNMIAMLCAQYYFYDANNLPASGSVLLSNLPHCNFNLWFECNGARFLITMAGELKGYDLAINKYYQFGQMYFIGQ